MATVVEQGIECLGIDHAVQLLQFDRIYSRYLCDSQNDTGTDTLSDIAVVLHGVRLRLFIVSDLDVLPATDDLIRISHLIYIYYSIVKIHPDSFSRSDYAS